MMKENKMKIGVIFAAVAAAGGFWAGVPATEIADVIDPKGPPTPSTDNNYATQTMAGGSCVTGGQGGNVTYLRSSSRFTWNNALVGNGFRICCPAVAH